MLPLSPPTGLGRGRGGADREDRVQRGLRGARDVSGRARPRLAAVPGERARVFEYCPRCWAFDVLFQHVLRLRLVIWCIFSYAI